MMMDELVFDITFKNLSLETMKSLTATVSGLSEKSEKSNEEETPSPAKKKRGRPAKTVSDEEDEDFGKKAMTEEDLEEEESNDDGDSDTDDSDSDGDDDSEGGLTFDEVREAVNKYGAKNPEGMKLILNSFNLKSSKELQKHKGKWEAVYRKTMAKLKAIKKSSK